MKKKIGNNVVIQLFLLAIISGTGVHAQEQAGPQGFFPDHFVNNGFEQTEEGGSKWSNPANMADALAKEEQPNPSGPTETGDLNNSDPRRVALGQHGEKVLSLGLIVNAVNDEHAKENIEELIGLSQTNAIPLSTVYAVGGIAQAKKDLPSVEYLWAQSRGARIKVTLGVPKQYEVSVSPTWIVETEEGLVLLEGIGSLKRALNAEGRLEFVPGVM